MTTIISQQALIHQLSDPMLTEALSVVSGCNHVVVDVTEASVWPTSLRLPACPVIAVGGQDDFCDISVKTDEIDELTAAINRQPVAAATLVQVLRHNVAASITDGLMAESLAYSALQQSSGFRRWCEEQPTLHVRTDALSNIDKPVLITERQGECYTITLDRPDKHNAYCEALKDALCEALQVPMLDLSIKEIRIHGNGKSFCAGGDLSEFGAVTDAAVAHLSRMTRSAAPLIASMRDRVRVKLHGACIGAGIELPAFAGVTAARSDAFFQLPEVAMGLIPGAGGTVSICKRIGKSRTAYMALTNRRIDAETALQWGLVDELIA